MNESCAVEQDVDGSNPSRKRTHGVLQADIERQQFPRQSFQFRSVEIGRNYAASLASKSYGSGASDPGAGRGDECSLPL
jgi:hypothetical protein